MFLLVMVCALFCPRKENQAPNITCPAVPPVFNAERNQTRVKVTWSPASAIDPEDGTLRSWVTSVWGPGAVLPEGSYHVTYMTKDSGGIIATCTRKFSVRVLRCSNSYTYLTNGQAVCTLNRLYGSRCQYACNPGYEISGSPYSECLHSTKWSKQKPVCREISCRKPQPVARGTFVCSSYSFRSECGVSCVDPGYVLKGSRVIRCQANEQWTLAGQCVDMAAPRIHCNNTLEAFTGPDMTPNMVDWLEPPATDNSNEIVVLDSSQQSGSNLTLGTHRVVFTGTDTAGLTSTCVTTINVQVKRCDASEITSEYAFVNCANGNAYGSECSFVCQNGYDLEGDESRFCGEDGLWSGNPVTCKATSCLTPPHIYDGHLECPEGNNFQDTCYLVCDQGYKMLPPYTSTCTNQGNWTSAGSCIDNQAPTFPAGCPTDIRISSPFYWNRTTVTFTWPAVTDNSGDNVSLVASQESGSDFGFGLTPVSITASDGLGNNNTCHFYVRIETTSCEQPDLDTERGLLDFVCPDQFLLGATCQLKCADGKPVQGSSNITCSLTTGSDRPKWTWEGNVAPHCQPDNCPQLPDPKYGKASCFAFDDFHQCFLSCTDPYVLPPTAPSIFFCTPSDGGQWTNDGVVPDCIAGQKPNKVLTRPVIAYQYRKCSDLMSRKIKPEITTKFQKIFNPRSGIRLGNISAKCSSQQADNNEIIMVTLEIDLGNYNNNGTAQQYWDYFEILVDQINFKLTQSFDKGGLDIFDANLFSFTEGSQEFQCNLGTTFFESIKSCTGCGKGYKLDVSSGSCSPCPKGSYQDQETATSCISCPTGMMTADIHSVSSVQCIKFCDPGEISATGLQPCYPCPRGSFQVNHSMTSCELCPFGMTTATNRSKSSQDCKFYNIRLNNQTNLSALKFPRSVVPAFTFLTWVHSTSSDRRLTLQFSVNNTVTSPDPAVWSFGKIQLYITPDQNQGNRSVSKWYHITVRYSNGTAVLFVDGKEIESLVGIGSSEVVETAFVFSPSESIQSLTLSDIQMTQAALPEQEIRMFSQSCGRRVQAGMLTVNEVDTLLVTPSTCDAENNCEGNPCGDHGTCVDELDHFTCICDDPWSGDSCQVIPDYCVEHRCAGGASCLNDVDNRSYKCVCGAGYTGKLCHDPIVDGSWGSWQHWQPCSVSCGAGVQIRTRECDEPRPNFAGQDCVGDKIESQTCLQETCPVDGGWSEWSAWSCSVSCGQGLASRHRTCDQPYPSYGGVICSGPSSEFEVCTEQNCPVNGQLGQWSEWTQCSVTCGGGSSVRRRACDSPPPAHGGLACGGNETEQTRPCNNGTCPACKKLAGEESNVTISCTTDDQDQMETCSISCRPGLVLVPDGLSQLKCGRLTNYTWSHQTKDNPAGKLPTCADALIPDTSKSTFNLQFDDVSCNPSLSELDFKNSIDKNLREMTPCLTTGECSSNTTVKLSCDSGRLSAGSVIAVVALEVPPNSTNGYLEKPPSSEIEAGRERLRLLDNITMLLVNKSKELSVVNVKGVTYTGRLKSTYLDVQCQSGSGFVDGLCVDCPAGSYSTGNGSCFLCGQGLYQTEIRQMSCIKCPEGLTTSGMGSSSFDDCMADPKTYMDYFDWSYDDVYETKQIIFPSDKDDFKMVIITVASSTLFLAVVCTFAAYIIHRTLGNRRMTSQQENTNVYKNDIFDKHGALELGDNMFPDTNIYDELMPEFEKELKELKEDL